MKGLVARLAFLLLGDEMIEYRTWAAQDLDRLFEILSDKDVTWNLSYHPFPYTMIDAANFLARLTSGQYWTQAILNEGKIIGSIGYAVPIGGDRGGMIGVFLMTYTRGRQIGSKALAHVINHAIESKVPKLQAIVFKDNIASSRLFLGNGFLCIGEACDYSMSRQTNVESYIYELRLDAKTR